MNTPASAKQRGGGIESVGTKRINYTMPSQIQMDVATPDRESVARRLEMEARVRRFLADFAEHCIQTVPASRRANGTQKLADMKRVGGKRHQQFVDTICDFVEVGVQAGNRHALSDAIRAVEVATAPVSAELWEEVNLDEEAAEAALDRAQFLAGPVPPCPTNAARVWEAAKQSIHALSRLRDEAAKWMHIKPKAV